MLMSLSCRGLMNAFTFQYGSIQILKRKNIYYVNIHFTFQYGSIQIRYILTFSYSCLLYIPIWFYSNSNAFTSILSRIQLYIPIWFYSNAEITCDLISRYFFTFQYGSIQIKYLMIALM